MYHHHHHHHFSSLSTQFSFAAVTLFYLLVILFRLAASAPAAPAAPTAPTATASDQQPLLIYEGVAILKGRIKLARADETLIESIQKSLGHPIDSLIDLHKPELALDISKIDDQSDANTKAYVVAKAKKDSDSSFLIAPLAIPETVKEDLENIEGSYIEVLLPREDGSEPVIAAVPDSHDISLATAPAALVKGTEIDASEVLQNFIRVELPKSAPEDLKKMMEGVQQALVYPSAFLTDSDGSIPIDVILGLFKHLGNESSNSENKAAEAATGAAQLPVVEAARAEAGAPARQAGSHSDEM